MTPNTLGREAGCLISEGLCPVDRARLVPSEHIRLGICPVCAYGFHIRSLGDGLVEVGAVQTFNQV